MKLTKIRVNRSISPYTLGLNFTSEEQTAKRYIVLGTKVSTSELLVFKFLSKISSKLENELESDLDNMLKNVNIFLEDGLLLSDVIKEKRQQNLDKNIFYIRKSLRYNSPEFIQRYQNNCRKFKNKYIQYLEKLDCKPSQAQAHFIKELNSIIKRCLPTLTVDHFDPNEYNPFPEKTFFFKKQDSQQIVAYDELEKSEQVSFDFLLDLYISKDKYDDSIYLIDEPYKDLGIEIGLNIFRELDRLIPKNCQIWVNETNFSLLTPFEEWSLA